MKNRKLRIVRVILWIIIIGLMASIFFLSGQKGQTSDNITLPLVDTITQDKPLRDESGNFNSETFQFRTDVALFLRKSAHIFEYLFLAVLFSIQFKLYGFKSPLNMSLTAFLCLFYAVLDEFHQTLVEGRSGELRDVLFDTAGIILGVLLTQAIMLLIEKSRKKRNTSKASKEAEI